MTKEEKYELIEFYIKGKLSGDALKAFEDQLEKDPALKEELTLHQEIFKGIHEPEIASFRSTLQSVKSELGSVTSTPRKIVIFPLKKVLAVAASILFLAFAIYLYQSSKVPTTDQLFADYFKAPSAEEFTINADVRGDGDTTELKKKWTAVNNAYGAANYPEAFSALESLGALEKERDKYFYHRGLLQLLNSQPEAALQSFEKVKAKFEENANWYSALALVQLQRIEEAKVYLQKVMDKSPEYQKNKAKTLLESLSKLPDDKR